MQGERLPQRVLATTAPPVSNCFPCCGIALARLSERTKQDRGAVHGRRQRRGPRMGGRDADKVPTLHFLDDYCPRQLAPPPFSTAAMASQHNPSMLILRMLV